MKVGRIYRYSSEKTKKDPNLEYVDDLPNYFYHTNDRHSNESIVFQRGIHGVSVIHGADCIDRRPAIIVSSSPHKAGLEQTPWKDEYSSDYGYIIYYGDNKTPGSKPEASPGNKLLLETFALHSSPLEEDRKRATPLVFFNRVAYNGRPKGNLSFQGFGIIESVELITQYDSKGDYFSNYVFHMCVFSLQKEAEEFDWAWINARRDTRLELCETEKIAPYAWKQWTKKGTPAISTLRRRVSSLSIVNPKDQLLNKSSAEYKTLQEIYSHYSEKKHHFELLALLVCESIFKESGARFIPGWVTQQSGDRGVDFVARVDVGTGLSSVKTIILGQAKCEKINVPTNGQHVARTVARLKRGWIGVYVTTSHFSKSVQEEIIEDQYPIMLVNGTKVAETVTKLAFEQKKSVEDFLAEIDTMYSSYQRGKQAEEVLNL